ncbi:nucleic acid/nucleotide deaminase domain-containing protein [Streptomyces sp. SL13]|uniref:Nucleic acid/nucleotide deaminase domain-containing protein n=1 Tax=Streptantibioticus silvisoli TaxID=2705255 RepID=A0AA90H6W1_9ACTN|nr:nucleic acid/nucleotide deaminase domain-containing protein [Streptantibioticus silvisoli]MDI5972316.1 nucleic acid/nucleotide deaminase domain-containing protein [Streptantibioticus silvisoli]
MSEHNDAENERLVGGIGVPRRVGPYFSTEDADPATLAGYAAVNGRKVAGPGSGTWTRFGTDGGFELCAQPGGPVLAVLLDYEEPERFVNTSAAAFASCLRELHAALRSLLTTDRPRGASQAFDALSERLRAVDPAAFADRERWWPRVLDDLRDTASVECYAAFEIVDARGDKQILTRSGGIAEHPEERLWQALRAAGVPPERVLRVHTDLEPCFMPGHYCSMWLAEVLPHAEMTHVYPYGETAESRADGLRRMEQAAAG